MNTRGADTRSTSCRQGVHACVCPLECGSRLLTFVQVLVIKTVSYNAYVGHYLMCGGLELYGTLLDGATY